MSYEISYRRQAFVMPAATFSHWDDLWLLAEQIGSNNCWELDNRRRARSWQCRAAGAQYEVMAQAVETAAACCGGSLVLAGRRRCEPESYIRAWRRAVAEAADLSEARRLGFAVGLFVRIDPGNAERRHAFETLAKQSMVEPVKQENSEVLTWRFNPGDPDQVRLWAETRSRGPGFRCADIDGPA